MPDFGDFGMEISKNLALRPSFRVIGNPLRRANFI
jgi:hypothetical protein